MTTIDNTPTPTHTVGPDAIVERVVGILNDGATCFLNSVGHELTLFDTLAALPPASSEQIADAAGLDERYVREWLGGVVTAGLVDYHPAERTYFLNRDYVGFLTGTGPNNLARTIRMLTLVGQAQPKVVDAFHNGGGLSYDDFPGFHDLQGEAAVAVTDAVLLDTVLPLAGLTDQLRSGIAVADIGCGQGHAINLMAREFPASQFVGLDFSAEAIASARAEASRWGLSNARFEVCDASEPATPASYDLVTAFDTIHDQAHPARVLANVRSALTPDGTFLMVDIKSSSSLEENRAIPWGAFIYTISTFHCMPVSLGQGGAGLGTAWGVQTAERMLREADFSTVEVHQLDADPFNVYFVARP